jgi:hypothetical protein
LAVGLTFFAGVPTSGWTATIEGYKFIDRNQNSVKDSGEGLADENIYIRDAETPASIETQPIATDSEGKFVYNVSSLGDYKVWEISQWPSLQTSHDSEGNAQIITIKDNADTVVVYFPVDSPKTLTASAAEVEIDKPVDFTISTEECDTTPFQVFWDFGNNKTSGPMEASGSPLTVTTESRYSNAGNFTVTGTLTYSGDVTEVLTTGIKVKANTDPVVPKPVVPNPPKTLTASAVEVKIDKPINFTISAGKGDTRSFQVTWDFGDGRTSEPMEASGSPLTVTTESRYSNAGDFTITANITYSGSSVTEVLTTEIKVKANANPVVEITSPVSSGEPVEIKAGDSYPLEATLTDPDAEDTHYLYWSIWDGGSYAYENISVTAPSSLSVPYTVSDDHNGTLQAWVSANDNDGGWASDSVTLSSLGIKITAPTGDALQNLESGQPVEFKATLTDLEDVDKHRIYWYFGDGGWNSWKELTVEGNPAETSVSYTYDGGDFTAWVYAYDSDWRRWTSDKVNLHVNGPINSNPTAEIVSATLTSGEEIDIATTPVKLERGQTVIFKIKIDDVDTWNQHRVYIDFGGSWEEITIPEDSTPPYFVEASHTYLGGNFTLWFSVADDKGGWTQTSLPIEVSGEPNADPSVAITLANDAYMGVPLKLDVEITDPDSFQSPLTASWYFGDGMYGNQYVDNPFSDSLYHTYEEAGLYNIYASVYDNAGGWASDNVSVKVRETVEDTTNPEDIDEICKNGTIIYDAGGVYFINSQDDFTTDTVIVIKEGAMVILSVDTFVPDNLRPVQAIKAICNMATLIVVNKENGSPPTLAASYLIANYVSGVIESAKGNNNGDNGDEGVSLSFSVGGNNSSCEFFNEGIIRAGRGGQGYTQGGVGGNLGIEATNGCNITQKGFLIAGEGGTANVVPKAWEDESYKTVDVWGGNGGLIYINAASAESSEGSVTAAGKGGDARAWYACIDNPECNAIPGVPGDDYITAGNLAITGTFTGKSLYAEPDIMLSGKGTHIVFEEDIVIFGGDNWQLKLNDLRDEAIKAGRDIVLAVGQDGVVDLRGNASKVFKAGGKFQIYSDNILVDDGVQLADLVEADKIEVSPAKILYHATFIGNSQVPVKPSTTIPINLTLSNIGPTEDTYSLSIKRVKKDIDPERLEQMVPPFMSSKDFKILEDISNAEGWTVNGLSDIITVAGLKQTELTLNVSSPTTLGEQETFVITAVSKADPTVKATFEVTVKVAEQLIRSRIDSDNDGVADEFDAFPTDASEWMDSDKDKVGNNADTDDDNDGMSDEWEAQYQRLYSTRYDADNDLDGDGYTNLDEYKADISPVDASSYPGTPESDNNQGTNGGNNATIIVRPPSVSGGVPLCPRNKLSINNTCNASGNTLPCYLTIEKGASVAQAVFECDVENKGWISNSTIKAGATVQGGILTGGISNEGILADFDFRGHSLIGGMLSGIIVNNSQVDGYFQDVSLAADTHIKAGRLKGNIIGDMDAPALIEEAELLEGSQLFHLTVGENTHVAKGVKIGGGVRFTQNDQIPTGTDLTAALVVNFVDNRLPTIDMNTDVLINAPSLLEQINGLFEIKDSHWQLVQNTENGQLELTIEGIRFAVLPVQVKRVNNQAKRAIHPDGESVTFITAQRREILTYPVIQDMSALMEAVAPLGIHQVILQKDGILTAELNDGESKVVARTDIAAIPVSNDEPLGLFPSELNSVHLIFEDDTGQKRQQRIYPTCAYPEALDDYGLMLDDKGRVSITIKGKRYQGIFDYVLSPNENGEQDTPIVFTPISENGNIVAFEVSYPTGEMQILRLIRDNT